MDNFNKYSYLYINNDTAVAQYKVTKYLTEFQNSVELSELFGNRLGLKAGSLIMLL